MLSKVEAYPLRVGARTEGTPHDASGRALRRVTDRDIIGRSHHADPCETPGSTARTMTGQERAFYDAPMDATRECQRLRDNPANAPRMVGEPGAVGACKRLPERSAVGEGLPRLREVRRLDLTVEAVAIRPVRSPCARRFRAVCSIISAGRGRQGRRRSRSGPTRGTPPPPPSRRRRGAGRKPSGRRRPGR